MNYANRQEAGRILADLLEEYAQKKEVIVLALPRGGVPVAYEIASRLNLPLDIFVVRKLGVPGHVEYAMGAIAPGDVVVFNEELLSVLHLSKAAINEVLTAEKQELARRERVYRGNRNYPSLQGKTIILVDDGIATGYSIRAAIRSLQQHEPEALIIAVPVAARDTCEDLAAKVNKIVCPLQPVNFQAVGLWYDDFSQTTDEEVLRLMEQAVLRHLA